MEMKKKASWKIKDVQSWSEGLRACVESHLPKRANSPFICLFVLSELSMDCVSIYSLGEGRSSLSNPCIQMQTYFRNTITDTPRNNALASTWVPLQSTKLMCKINHDIIYKFWILKQCNWKWIEIFTKFKTACQEV